jgi:hypothetical protein
MSATPGVAGTRLPVPLPTMPTSHSRSTSTIPDRNPSAQAGFAAVNFDGTLDRSTDYNSTGTWVAVGHTTHSGQYLVTFGNLAFPGGDAQVSAVDGGYACVVVGWGESGSDLEVGVTCYNWSGIATDAAFYVLVTQPHSRPAGVLDYDWVNRASGTLSGVFQYNSSHRRNSVRHLGTGRYVVTMPGPGVSGANKGTVKVSPYGSGPGNCQVASWHTTSAGQQIGVACFAVGGAPMDREFTIVYARGNNLMGQNGKEDANALAVGPKSLYQPAVQFDSKRGARVSVVHLDKGIYEVLFIGSTPTHHFSGGSGNIQITAVGAAPRYCGIALGPSHNPLGIVSCFSATGHLADTGFVAQLVFN